MKSLLLALLATTLALPTSAAETPKIPLADTETIVFLGDSITAWRINYSMYAQAFLVSRFPGKHLTIHSFGYGGQTAEYASTIYPTEIAAVKPTTVFVDYGMNDGRYKPFDEANNKWYLDSQRALARAIKASGAREVLLTTSPLDTEVRPDKGFYNDTLGRMADSVIGLGKELQLPVADIFHPMLATQNSVKAARPGYTLQVDSVHPTPVGHLVMAYHLLNNIEMPHVAADIAIKSAPGAAPAVSSSAGAQPENVTVKDGAIDFDLALPFLPYYVPAEAREALTLVPFENDLNKFRLQAAGWDPARKCALVVNKREVATFTAAQLAAGIDLAQLDGAPWSDAAKKVNEIAALRPNRLDILPDYHVRNLPSFAKLAAANTEYMDELGGAMTSLAQPGKYHFSLVPVDRVLTSLEVSPAYPASSVTEFDKAFAPETTPGTVAWKTVPLQNGVIDFLPMLGPIQNCAVYCRAVVDAPKGGKLHLEMGSDDGLTVFVNGKKLLAKNVTRGMTIGDDKLDAELKRGRNTLLFRVSQNAAGFRFGVTATPVAGAQVTQMEAP